MIILQEMAEAISSNNHHIVMGEFLIISDKVHMLAMHLDTSTHLEHLQILQPHGRPSPVH